MTIQLQLGLDVIRSYKRLSYTPWHALAEFVDNSTQSYFNNRQTLDESYKREGKGLEVSITYDRATELLRIADNAMGMSLGELDHALHVGARPADTTGRSKFGMGMKTAACWFGNLWTIKTKKLGETTEYFVTVDVDSVADGANTLPMQSNQGKDPKTHYTVLEIKAHNRRLQGRTLGKIRDFLSSMYRKDIADGSLTLLWQGDSLEWPGYSDDQFLKAPDGTHYKKPFEFAVNGKRVAGWVGVLRKGSRARAGFSILHAGRVVRGWPDSWRPESIYGQLLGSNDLVNQRLVGELYLDDFDVSHTKDDILWLGDDEDQVQDKLKEVCADYSNVARSARKGTEDQRGPSDLEVQTAVEELQQELSSEEMVDLMTVEPVLPPELVRQAFLPLREGVVQDEQAFSADIGGLEVVGYLAHQSSPNDPYVLADATNDQRVLVVINLQHPHFRHIAGSEGVLNYFRDCTYDAIAEWQARHRTARLDPDTIKILKDKLLRVPMAMEIHAND